MVVRDLLDGFNVYGQRGLRLLARLVDMHLEVAQREATREQIRLQKAATVLAIGSTFLMTGFVLIQVLIVLLMLTREQDWLLTGLGLIGCDLVLGGLLIYFARRRLQAPFMPETRAQLTKTTAILTKDEFL